MAAQPKARLCWLVERKATTTTTTTTQVSTVTMPVGTEPKASTTQPQTGLMASSSSRGGGPGGGRLEGAPRA